LGGVGEQQALGRALEQGGAHIVFQVLDLLRDRAGRDGQLVRRATEVQVTRRCLKSTQSVQGRKAPSGLHRFTESPGRTPWLRNGRLGTSLQPSDGASALFAAGRRRGGPEKARPVMFRKSH